MRSLDHRGQATVELALTLPLLALVLAAAIEVTGLASDRVRLWHAAREAARVAVVDPDPEAALDAAQRGGLEGIRLDIDPDPQSRVAGRTLAATVSYRPRGRVPILRELFSHVLLRATAVMRIEQP